MHFSKACFSALIFLFFLLFGNRLDAQVNAPSRGWSDTCFMFDSLEIHLFNIPEDGGPVKASYRFKNTGEKDIRILKVDNSCSCVRTSVTDSLVKAGNWCTLNVSYYPKGHPGRHDRTIFLYTDASDDDGLSAVLSLCTQVDMSDDHSDDYPIAFGNLRMMRKNVSFHLGKKAVERIAVINVSGSELKPSFQTALLPADIKASFEKTVLAAGEETDIIISYEGGDSVHISDKPIPLKVNGTGLPASQNSISIYIK